MPSAFEYDDPSSNPLPPLSPPRDTATPPSRAAENIRANIGFSVDLDLHEKSLHKIGSIWCQNHVESNLYVFVSVQLFFFVFRSESFFCPFKNTASGITWRYCHLILDLYGVCIIRITCLDPILYI